MQNTENITETPPKTKTKKTENITDITQKLAKKLKLHHNPDMIDWAWEVRDFSRLKEFISLYETEKNQTKKNLLMRLILHSANKAESSFVYVWFQIKDYVLFHLELVEEFLQHPDDYIYPYLYNLNAKYIIPNNSATKDIYKREGFTEDYFFYQELKMIDNDIYRNYITQETIDQLVDEYPEFFALYIYVEPENWVQEIAKTMLVDDFFTLTDIYSKYQGFADADAKKFAVMSCLMRCHNFEDWYVRYEAWFDELFTNDYHILQYLFCLYADWGVKEQYLGHFAKKMRYFHQKRNIQKLTLKFIQPKTNNFKLYDEYHIIIDYKSEINQKNENYIFSSATLYFPQINHQKKLPLPETSFYFLQRLVKNITREHISTNEFSEKNNVEYCLEIENQAGNLFYKMNWKESLEEGIEPHNVNIRDFIVVMVLNKELEIDKYATQIFKQENLTQAEKIAHNNEAIRMELEWLKLVIQERFYQKNATKKEGLKNIFDINPPMPNPNSALGEVIMRFQLDFSQRIILALTLAPHIRPEVLDGFFIRNEKYDRTYSEAGGLKGKFHSGYIPTLETACFLIADTDIPLKMQTLSLIHDASVLVKNNILKVDVRDATEPIGAGMLCISGEYLAYLTNSKDFAPSSTDNFPAELLTTDLDWADLHLEKETRQELQNLEKWLANQQYIHEELGLKKHLQKGYKVLFYGSSGTGKTLTATLLGKNLGMDVYKVDMSMISSKWIGETSKNLAKLFDMAENRNWILVFDEAESLFGKRVQDVQRSADAHFNQEVGYLLQRIENYSGLVILTTNFLDNMDTAFMRRFQALVHFPVPSPTQQLALWNNIFTKKLPLAHDVSFETLSQKYVLTGANIVKVLRESVSHSLHTTDRSINMKTLTDAIEKELKPSKTDKFPAELLDTNLAWEDLYLEEETRQELQNLETWLTYQHHINEELGLKKYLKQGYRALFYGSSGTGKTLTATLLGKNLGMDVYKVDVSKITSKWVGETAQNLARLFDMAENRHWILFFDEAESLFGKRIQEAQRSTDAYYNQEVGYLLQRIENYNGLVILATNLLDNVDTAFMRRFQSLVHFPLPSPTQQFALWNSIFTKKLPLAHDINFEILSQKYVLTGANITNILRESVLQSLQTAHRTINMEILINATEKELKKSQMKTKVGFKN